LGFDQIPCVFTAVISDYQVNKIGW